MESPENSNQFSGGELIFKSTRATDIHTFGIESIVEHQDGAANSGCCVDDTIETKTRQVTINDLPHDILMNTFDDLNPCIIACLGLTSRRFYTSCKIYHPKPFNLALCVDQKCAQDLSVALCHPLGRCQFSDKAISNPRYKIIGRWFEDTPLQIIRAEWYPGHGKYLADLIENWQGLHHYRKTCLDRDAPLHILPSKIPFGLCLQSQ
ncbi:uncharacterized protein EAF01_011161 [Botrytis porri]|uniref:uncharacterized protein n=1 Tax=Botrytis porri TaxID=87229 RepID=UPI0019022274|nr:uncharacterized protein EAF01_011161 [Botrytis porri]KAF7888007.1 hypothetical protein EAF01_011161 [Botrytis porri]